MANDKIQDFSLLKKYQALLIENDRLKAENKKLKERLAILNSSQENIDEIELSNILVNHEEEIYSNIEVKSSPELQDILINQRSKSEEKIKLFMSFFKRERRCLCKKMAK